MSNQDFEPVDFDSYEYNSAPGTGFSEFRPETYEQLQLTREKRQLATAQRRKYESLKRCLELKRELAETEHRTAVEKRQAAEAERDKALVILECLREQRAVPDAQRRAAEAEARCEESKRTTAKELVHAAQVIKGLEDALTDEYNKRIGAELRDTINTEAGDFYPLCGSCGERMGRGNPDESYLTCPACGNHCPLPD